MSRAPELYLDLLCRSLVREVFTTEPLRPFNRHTPALRRSLRWRAISPALDRLESRGLVLARVPAAWTASGPAAPATAETTVGLARLRRIVTCIHTILDDGIPGDLVEAGVWRTGTAVLMRGALEALDVGDRRVWLVPAPNAGTGGEASDLATFQALAGDAEDLRKVFSRYGLLDERVRFADARLDPSVDTGGLEQACLVRLDADHREATRRALDRVYPLLAPGGFLVIDDHGHVPGAREAVRAFREAQGITAPVEAIDGSGIYWRKT